MQWVLGIVYLFFIYALWQFFVVLFAATAIASLLVAVFLSARATMLARAPGVIEVHEQNGSYVCTIHPSAYDRIGLIAVYFPLIAYLVVWLFMANNAMQAGLDFMDVLGLVMLLPPVFLVFKFAPKLEWFAKSPLERFAKKATDKLRIPEFLIQSDAKGREMARALSGQWSPSYTERYFQRLEMEPTLLQSEKAQLEVIEEFRKPGVHDLNLLSTAEDHWKAVDALVKIASETAIVLKDDQMKSDAAFLAKSLCDPELSNLLEFRDFGEFYDVMMAIQKDAEKLLELVPFDKFKSAN
jgi:hypothetical protein